MRRASLPLRLDRLADRGHAADREGTVRGLAEAYGLGVAEVRAELAAIEENARRFGPSTLAQVVQRSAAEFGLPETEVWAELTRITGNAGTRP